MEIENAMDTLMDKREKLKKKLSIVQAEKLLNNEKSVITQEKTHLCKENLTLLENKLSSEQILCEALLKKNVNLNQQKMMAEMTGISEKAKFDSKIKLMKEYQKQFEDWSGNINTLKQTALSQRVELENVNQIKLVSKKSELEQEIVSKIEEREQILNLVNEIESACNILKKRNNAVLILMRKNLQASQLKMRHILQELNARKNIQ